MKIRPLKDRVVIKYSSESMEKTAGGLFVPDVAKEKPQKGTVTAVGSEVKEVKEGNTVLFDQYAGSRIKIDDTEYLVIKEEELLGIVE
jgi:chaperonin GroES